MMLKLYTLRDKLILVKLPLFILCFLFCQVCIAQIYSNGNLSTGATAANGTFAPTGYTWSEMQANTGNTSEVNFSFGFGALYNNALSSNLQLADNFTVPVGESWGVTSFDFFCYQTSYAGTVPPIDVLRVQIFNGDPSAGGTLVTGDMTTNVYDATNSADALMYRISNTIVPIVAPTGTARKIWKVRATISASLVAGTYWVVFQGHATNDANFFMIPVTLLGSRGAATANAKQFTVTGAIWATVLDGGNPAAAPDVAQDMAFLINGVVTLSTSQYEKKNNFQIFPNPVNSSFKILNTDNLSIYNVDFIDNLGRIVKNSIPKDSEMNFDCSELEAGNYLVKIKSENGVEIKKMIKN